jgi:hypothetical protein
MYFNITTTQIFLKRQLKIWWVVVTLWFLDEVVTILGHCCMTPEFLGTYAAPPTSRGLVDSFDTIGITVAGH